ncbi:hypothetical protein [Halomonas sp. A3H3]|uniref:hypothetical protein n=1 Tax=Halomonas sp. A3H3 TaxID=1346287 RepID=UPI000A4946C1|nr:hypothetical protein [Halomonas sp. A3H3]
MTVKIFDTPEVQEFVKTVAGFDQAGGNDRTRRPTASSARASTPWMCRARPH